MDKTELDRLRALAGAAPAAEEKSATGNMYQIRDTLMEAAKPDFADIDGDGDEEETAKKAADDKEKMDEAEQLEEEMSSCCGAGIDSPDGEFGRCMACGEMSSVEHEDEEFEYDLSDREGMNEFHYGTEEEWKEKVKKTADAARKGLGMKQKHAKTEQQQMREWSNSVYKQWDDRGHYIEQPEGETVDLSLRRYLDADASPVKIEEDIDPEAMLKEYKEFKGE